MSETRCAENYIWRGGGILSIVATFLLVCFAWIFFRANNIVDAGTAVAKLFSDYKFSIGYISTTWNKLQLTWYFVVYSVFAIVLMMNLEKFKSEQLLGDSKVYKHSWVRYALYLVMAFAVIISWIYLQASDIGSSFIYFQF